MSDLRNEPYWGLMCTCALRWAQYDHSFTIENVSNFLEEHQKFWKSEHETEWFIRDVNDQFMRNYKTDFEGNWFPTDSDICIMAMKYAIGRMTYMPTIVTEFIENHFQCFSKKELAEMINHIVKFKSQHSLGMECDVQTWENFLFKLKQQTKE